MPSKKTNDLSEALTSALATSKARRSVENMPACSYKDRDGKTHPGHLVGMSGELFNVYLTAGACIVHSIPAASLKLSAEPAPKKAPEPPAKKSDAADQEPAK